MSSFEWFAFWVALILLLALSLTSTQDWWKLIKRAYHRAIMVYKWQPFTVYITGMPDSHRSSKSHDSEMSSEPMFKHKVFPRSRRSTF